MTVAMKNITPNLTSNPQTDSKGDFASIREKSEQTKYDNRNVDGNPSALSHVFFRETTLRKKLQLRILKES